LEHLYQVLSQEFGDLSSRAAGQKHFDTAAVADGHD
jgi:hypothetical protein